MKLKGVWRDLLKFLFAKLREEIYFRLSLIHCIDPVSNKLRSSLLKLLKAFISKLLREFHFYFFRIFYTRRLLLVFVCHPQICKSGYEKLTDKYFELFNLSLHLSQREIFIWSCGVYECREGFDYFKSSPGGHDVQGFGWQAAMLLMLFMCTSILLRDGKHISFFCLK